MIVHVATFGKNEALPVHAGRHIVILHRHLMASVLNAPQAALKPICTRIKDLQHVAELYWTCLLRYHVKAVLPRRIRDLLRQVSIVVSLSNLEQAKVQRLAVY
jgi:hypothetical protein